MQGVGVGAEGGWLAKAISLAKLMMSPRAAGQPPHAAYVSHF